MNYLFLQYEVRNFTDKFYLYFIEFNAMFEYKKKSIVSIFNKWNESNIGLKQNRQHYNRNVYFNLNINN